MYGRSLLGFALAATVLCFCTAQSPPDSAPATSNSLSVTYVNTTIQPPGITVPVADVAKAPSLVLPGNQNGTYAVIMIDLSFELNGPNSPNTTLLHWLLPGLSGSSESDANSTALQSDQAAIATYVSPAPPANQTHTYALYLFTEPASFSIPTSYTAYFKNLTASVYNRVGFNLTDFTEMSGLGEPVAANYFLVTNATKATASSSGAVATASYSANSATARGVEMWIFATALGAIGGLYLSGL